MLKVLFLVALLALAIYLVVRAVQRQGLFDQHRPHRRPFAPDDDPDFLRDLERKRRHPDDPDAV